MNKHKCLDFCFVRGATARFRANLHFQRGTLAASIRVLPSEVPTLESLNLPPSLSVLAERRQGLILLTGATGCGKTSTMAALINAINGSRQDHIITIEDPIEFQQQNQISSWNRSKWDADTPRFAQAVRAVLRQDPDVILIGEMRDSETMAAALTAAETGHLVLTSLHTNDAAQASRASSTSSLQASNPRCGVSSLSPCWPSFISACCPQSTESTATPPLKSSWPPAESEI